MSEIDVRASDIAGNAKLISDASMSMAQRTERQAASLEETSAAMVEITSTVNNSAENAKQSEAVAASALDYAKRNEAIAQNTIEAMHSIAKSSNEISLILSVMDEIAFQTNLLALNAGVEAARAGETGRGFAVVASEVRALAGRSADAAKQIKALIDTSGSQIEHGVKLVDESASALSDIVNDIGHISKLMSQIASAQTEEASALNEISVAVGHMDRTTQENAAMTHENTQTAKAVADGAHELALLISKFRAGDSNARKTKSAA